MYIDLCQMHSLYKCQIFQLYNFYVLYVLNTSHKLYLYMKLYMVSELSISCLLFTLIPPPPVNVRAVRNLLECILVFIIIRPRPILFPCMFLNGTANSVIEVQTLSHGMNLTRKVNMVRLKC